MPDVLQLLITERDRLNRAIEVLGGAQPKRRGRKPGSVSTKAAAAVAKATKKRRGRKKMSAAARKAVSERMRKYWAARRKGKK